MQNRWTKNWPERDIDGTSSGSTAYRKALPGALLVGDGKYNEMGDTPSYQLLRPRNHARMNGNRHLPQSKGESPRARSIENTDGKE